MDNTRIKQKTTVTKQQFAVGASITAGVVIFIVIIAMAVPTSSQQGPSNTNAYTPSARSNSIVGSLFVASGVLSGHVFASEIFKDLGDIPAIYTYGGAELICDSMISDQLMTNLEVKSESLINHKVIDNDLVFFVNANFSVAIHTRFQVDVLMNGFVLYRKYSPIFGKSIVIGVDGITVDLDRAKTAGVNVIYV